MTPRTPSLAWDVLYETEQGASWLVPPEEFSPGTRVENEHPRPDTQPHGWTGPLGPAIASRSWPRSPSGLPMRHAITLWLPQEYLVHGPEYAGIAVFQGDSERDTETSTGDPASEDPFLADLAAHRPHPMATLQLSSFAARHFASVWLRADELLPGPTPPPADLRRPGEHRTHGPNAWDDPLPMRRVWLLPRPDDPNVGIAIDDRAAGYIDPVDEATGDDDPWFQPWRTRDHLGGTFAGLDWTPRVGPHYLQLDANCGLVTGTNYARRGYWALDLTNGHIEWFA